MKKNCMFASALALACVLALSAGCGKPPPEPIEPAPPAEDGFDEEIGTDTPCLALSDREGVYEEELVVQVKCASAENVVYYTLDGTLPTVASAHYNDKEGIFIGRQNSRTLTEQVTYGAQSTYGSYTYGTVDGCRVLRLLETDASGKEVGRRDVTYFINEKGEADYPVPVLSIVLDPEEAIGFYNDRENESKARATLSYFDFASGERFCRNTQIKLGGNWTKGFPYRTMNLNFNKDEKGNKNAPVTADLFRGRTARNGEALTDFTRFRLHSGGNAQTTVWFADAFAQRAAAELNGNGGQLQAATTGYRPCEVYLCGEYWGLYAIREHYSDVYFAQNYGVDKDDVILVDSTTALSDGEEFNRTYAFEIKEDDEEGRGMALAAELFDFLMTGDFTDPQTYERLTQMIDVTSLSDMVLTHLYAGNWDFMYNNIKMWRTGSVDKSNPYADGRWRFCLHDLDFAFEQQWGDNGVYHANGYLLLNNDDWVSHLSVPYEEYTKNEITYRPGANYLDFYLGNAEMTYQNIGVLSKEISCLLSSPMRNAQFREIFLNRAQTVKGVYASAEAHALLAEMKEEVSAPMKRHLTRWRRSDYTYTKWQTNTAGMDEVLTVRPYMKDYLDFYELGRLMYANGDYFERQIEAALWRFNRK